MQNYLSMHLGKVLLLIVTSIGLWVSSSLLAETKAITDINTMDLFGEGGSAALSLVWMIFILSCRPHGRVTNLLYFGLLGIYVAACQDFIDEFYAFNDGLFWPKFIESAPATIGIILLSIGLRHWYQEQQAFNEQLLKKERFYREHATLDYVTGLYNAEYMQQQIQRELELCRRSRRPLSLFMLDLDNFDAFNQRYGDKEGDLLLQQAGDIIRMNLRRHDLACRYAGDRFIALLPETHLADAKGIAEEINHAMQALAHKSGDSQESVHVTFSIGVAGATASDSTVSLIDKANAALQHAKRCGKNNFQLSA